VVRGIISHPKRQEGDTYSSTTVSACVPGKGSTLRINHQRAVRLFRQRNEAYLKRKRFRHFTRPSQLIQMREMEDDGDVGEKLMRAAYSLFSFLFITSSFSISSKKNV
jgi:hypothetical protein